MVLIVEGQQRPIKEPLVLLKVRDPARTGSKPNPAGGLHRYAEPGSDHAGEGEAVGDDDLRLTCAGENLVHRREQARKQLPPGFGAFDAVMVVEAATLSGGGTNRWSSQAR